MNNNFSDNPYVNDKTYMNNLSFHIMPLNDKIISFYD